MTLYHTATTPPSPLPFRITLADGSLRTDAAGQLAEGHLTPADIAGAGFMVSPEKPVAGANERVSWSGTEWTVEPAPRPTEADVGAERDRRLNDDFEFQGKMYQRDERSLSRITGAATLAGFAMGAGAQAGNLRWANPAQDFGWIASDDTVTPMDAQTCFAFGQAAAAVESALVFAAAAIRAMNPIPYDFTDDAYWP